MLEQVSKNEKIEQLKKELTSIRERIESDKYTKGFCNYLLGKEKMIREFLEEYYGVVL